MEEMITPTDTWKKEHPSASVGFLALEQVENPASHTGLEEARKTLEDSIRQRFSGFDRAGIEALPVMQAYHAYYKPFKKSYHVQLQVESVAFKGKSIPSTIGLVEAMFMAELKNMLLTAGHDLDRLDLPVRVDSASGEETYTLMNGQPQTLKQGDMYMADSQGILSSIIYGPDQRTRITPATRRVLYAIYAPPGIEVEQVRQHLQDIAGYVKLFSPQARVQLLEVYHA